MRRTAAVLFAMTLGGALVAAGCEAFFPLGDLGPGGVDGSSQDAPADVAAADGGPDRVPGEAGPGDSPVSDALDASRACEAGFCACLSPQPAFCDDFDHGALGALWDAQTCTQTDGATLAFDMDAWTSPPRSLALSVPALNGAVSDLATYLPATFSEARVEVDMLAPQGFGDGDQVVSLEFGTGSCGQGTGSLALLFTVFGGSVHVTTYEEPGAMGAEFDGAAPPEAGAWMHVTFIYHPQSDAGLGFVRLSYGNPDAGAPVFEVPTAHAENGPMSLQLGSVYVQSTNGWQAAFDNAVVRFTP